VKTNPKVDSLAFKLNEAAIQRFQNYNLGLIIDKNSLQLSLDELDKALQIEPKNSVFYSNKTEVLLTLDREDEALKLMEQAVQLIPSYAEGYTFIGFINEYNGEIKEAKGWFRKASNAYDKRIQENKYVVNSKVNKAFLYFFLENEQKALQEFENLKREYPDDNNVLYMEFVFYEFDKKEFLNEILLK
jgi:tetratricopeptide (TPR) repeat protein